MLKETMTAQERIEAALNLEEVDRTPVGLLASMGFAYKCQGLKIADAYSESPEQAERVVHVPVDMCINLGLDCLHSDGRNDMPNASMPILPSLRPGLELADNMERQEMGDFQVMHEDDYDLLIKMGIQDFWLELFNRLAEKMDDGTVNKGCIPTISTIRNDPKFKGEKRITWEMIQIAKDLNNSIGDKRRLLFEKKGIPVLTSASLIDPMGSISAWRTYPGLMMDIQHQYDKLKVVVQEIMTPYLLEMLRGWCRRPATKRLHIGGALVLIPYVSRKIFEEMSWSFLLKAAEVCWEENVMPVFHLDTNWDECLEYFKELPRGKFAVQFDSNTNIFKAKEILAGHCCITGDVSGTMLCIATPNEVENYCKELIDIVGKGGGFILYNGCMVPATAKVENVRAMVHTAKNYKGK